MIICILAKDGTKLMPTDNIQKINKMIKDGRAELITRYPVYVVQLTYDLLVQPMMKPVELCVATGDHRFAVSVKSETHEFYRAQFNLLTDEKMRHDDCRRYRRARRNRKRYREPRFDNRTKPEGWLPPSIENKCHRQADIIEKLCSIFPVTKIYIETARFDTQLLEAQQSGSELPEGEDYQHGPKYGLNNLREAVFTRDHYTCQVCGKSVSDGAILRVHHALYWKGDHTDRLSGLMTVCTKCHTAANHQKGGVLWGIKPRITSMASAAYMNAIRYHIVDLVKERLPEMEIHVTNGAAVKAERRMMRMEKSPTNDAYCMGEFRPKHKAQEEVYQKRRRNKRVLSRFYDAKYIDIRDGKEKKGSELGCNRTSRAVPRDNPDNLRIYRGEKTRKGQTRTRRQRYAIQPDDIVLIDGKKYEVISSSATGRLFFRDSDGKKKSVSKKKAIVLHRAGGWKKTG